MQAELQPYVGPKPFEEPDRKLFFGRDAEANNLFSLIVAHPAVLVYAQSGAGKTSLLNAKIIPTLKAEAYEVLPIARVQGIETDAASNVYVFNTLISWADGHSAESPELARMTLAQFLKRRPHVQKVPDVSLKEPEEAATEEKSQETEEPPERWELPRFAVFDQFEELFTSYPDRWKEREAFFEQIRDALDDDYLLRVVFMMREDYIAELDPFVSLLPGDLRVRVRLERLREQAALDAVEKPLQFTTRRFDHGVARKLVQNLLQSSNGRPGADQFVETVQLQVVCQNLWQSLEPDATVITAKDLEKCGDVKQALMSFYEKSIRTIVGENGIADGKRRIMEGDLRRWFEKVLITPEKKRATVDRRAERTGDMPNETIIVPLERVQLIKGEWRAGARWYELSHDRFIDPILTSNQNWRAAQSGAEQIRERLETRAVEYAQGVGSLLNQDELVEAKRLLAHQRDTKLAPSRPLRNLIQASLVPEQRRKLRFMRLGVAALVIIVVLMGSLTTWAMIERSTAKNKRAEADHQGSIARIASAAAETKRKEAEVLLARAVTAERDAKRDRDQAQDAKDRAEMQRSAAEKATRDAVRARQELAKSLEEVKKLSDREKAANLELGLRRQRLLEIENWNVYGWGRSDSGNLEGAKKAHNTALEQYQAAHDSNGEANSLTYLARVYALQAGGQANRTRAAEIARAYLLQAKTETPKDEQKNNFKQAEQFYLKAVGIREKESPDSKELARVNEDLAVLYDGQEQKDGDDKAELRYRQALDIRKSILAKKIADKVKVETEDYSQLAASYTNLAGLYQQEGRYSEAEPLLRRALDELDKAPDDNASRADSLNMLGVVSSYQGKYHEAEEFYRRALDINTKENTRGAESPWVGTNKHNLALAYLARAEYAEAKKSEEAALLIYRKAPVVNHDRLALSYMTLARINSDEDKYGVPGRIKCDENNSGPEACFKLSIAEAVQAAGERSRRPAIMKHYLAEFYAVQGDYKQAEAIETDALAVLKERYKPDHWLISRSESTLAAIRAAQGKEAEAKSLYAGAKSLYADAEKLYKQALSNLKEKLGPNHAEVSNTLAGLAKLYLTEQKYSEAEPLFKEAFAIRGKVRLNHPYLIDILENYADLLQKTGRDAEAKDMHARADDIRNSVRQANQK